MHKVWIFVDVHIPDVKNHSESTEQLVPLSHICLYFKSSDYSTSYLMCQWPNGLDVRANTQRVEYWGRSQCCFRSLISAGCGCVVHCLPAKAVLCSYLYGISGQYASHFLLFHLTGAPEDLELNL